MQRVTAVPTANYRTPEQNLAAPTGIEPVSQRSERCALPLD